MNNLYCVKCKSFTENKGKIVHKKTKNGQNYVQVKCKKCGIKKTQFVGSS